METVEAFEGREGDEEIDLGILDWLVVTGDESGAASDWLGVSTEVTAVSEKELKKTVKRH